MDYEYQLFVERPDLGGLLEALGGYVDPDDDVTTLVLPGRTVTLPYATWADTPHVLRWDDPAPAWQFAITMCFEPDDAITDYLRPRTRFDPAADSPRNFDDRGRARIGYVYLTVTRDLGDLPSGTGEDLVRFSFGTPGSTMSVLFLESESIRRTFLALLSSCRGVYGLFDREDQADLIWWRGREMAEVLPTAAMSLADIEGLLGLGPTR